MEKRLKPVLGIVIYIGMCILTYGADFSYWQKCVHGHFSHDDVATDRAISGFFASNPIGWLAVFLCTGFYSQGFQFTHKHLPECKNYEPSWCEYRESDIKPTYEKEYDTRK